jgi:nucleotide-binding universal stress UspA family protein
MSQTKKILWAISPTESDKKMDASTQNFLECFTKAVDTEIQPVYVLSADYFITSEYFEPIDIKGLKNNMLQECQQYISQFSGINCKEPMILENNFSARAAEVHFFCEYVEKTKPDFVLMNTHGRKGWARTFIGSFAESFLLKSKVPTILIGPEYQTLSKIDSALMPIQLSESSQKFVEGFLDDHRLSFLKSLTLFHKISMVDVEEIAWAPGLYGLADFSGADLLEKAKETTENYLKAFMDHPLSQKRLSYEISQVLEPIADVIVKEGGKEKYDLTVMRSECGTLEANLLGSVTRDVIRHAKTPVIVYPR